MKFFYDLHIHSDLSPCADSEMTPNNIVRMAKLKELDVISVTDHNAINNYPSLKILADREGICLIPGIEITSRENVHLLAYFREYEKAREVADFLYSRLPDIKNKPKVFGEQNIYDENDNVIGNIEKLLINATDLSIKNIIDLVRRYNGVIIPAHVDKISDGIIGVLGFIPEDYGFEFVEIYNREYKNKLTEMYRILFNSDAHRLEDISEPENYIIGNDIEEVLNTIGI